MAKSASTTKPTNPGCPHCHGPMVRKRNGATGQAFWGCARFPNCKGARSADGEPSRPSNARNTPAWDDDANEAPEPDTRLPSERQRDNDDDDERRYE